MSIHFSSSINRSFWTYPYLVVRIIREFKAIFCEKLNLESIAKLPQTMIKQRTIAVFMCIVFQILCLLSCQLLQWLILPPRNNIDHPTREAYTTKIGRLNKLLKHIINSLLFYVCTWFIRLFNFTHCFNSFLSFIQKQEHYRVSIIFKSSQWYKVIGREK